MAAVVILLVAGAACFITEILDTRFFLLGQISSINKKNILFDLLKFFLAKLSAAWQNCDVQ